MSQLGLSGAQLSANKSATLPSPNQSALNTSGIIQGFFQQVITAESSAQGFPPIDPTDVGSVNDTYISAINVTPPSGSVATGYHVGDGLQIGGTGNPLDTPATITVTSVNGTGQITGASLSSGGAYVDIPVPYGFTGGHGTGGINNITADVIVSSTFLQNQYRRWKQAVSSGGLSFTMSWNAGLPTSNYTTAPFSSGHAVYYNDPGHNLNLGTVTPLAIDQGNFGTDGVNTLTLSSEDSGWAARIATDLKTTLDGLTMTLQSGFPPARTNYYPYYTQYGHPMHIDHPLEIASGGAFFSGGPTSGFANEIDLNATATHAAGIGAVWPYDNGVKPIGEFLATGQVPFITDYNRVVESWALHHGGSGYSAGDSLTAISGGHAVASFTVASVSAGVITGLTYVGSSANFEAGPEVTLYGPGVGTNGASVFLYWKPQLLLASTVGGHVVAGDTLGFSRCRVQSYIRKPVSYVIFESADGSNRLFATHGEHLIYFRQVSTGTLNHTDVLELPYPSLSMPATISTGEVITKMTVGILINWSLSAYVATLTAPPGIFPFTIISSW